MLKNDTKMLGGVFISALYFSHNPTVWIKTNLQWQVSNAHNARTRIQC